MSSDGAPRAKEIVAMPAGYGGPDAQVFRPGAVALTMISACCRMLGALALASALLVPASAQAAVPGVNVTSISHAGEPSGGWQNVADSGAKTIRSFVEWHTFRGGTRDFNVQRYTNFTNAARARG